MKVEDNGKRAVELKKAADTTQIKMIVDDYKVKLNFPPKSDVTAISDIKRMMLGGAVKT